MYSPLVQRLIEQLGLPQLDATNTAQFLLANEKVVLFFAENPNRYPESDDVAAVFPEILKEFQQLSGAVVHPAYQPTLKQSFEFSTWPALVFITNQTYQGAITGIKNWEDYQREIPTLMLGPSSSPSTHIPLVNL